MKYNTQYDIIVLTTTSLQETNTIHSKWTTALYNKFKQTL